MWHPQDKLFRLPHRLIELLFHCSFTFFKSLTVPEILTGSQYISTVSIELNSLQLFRNNVNLIG